MKRVLPPVTLMLLTFAIPAQAFDHRLDEVQAPRGGVIQAPLDADGIQAPRDDEPQAPVKAEEPTP
jgi:hypothetical protein